MRFRPTLLALAGALLGGLAWPVFSAQPIETKAEGTNELWVDTPSIKAGQSAWSYCYLRTYEELSALSVEVHYDPSVFAISTTYNQVSAQIYDSSIHEDYVSYTYVFDSIITEQNVTLFSFYCSVSANATPGQYYFDVIVKDAYNSSLEEVNISSLRKYFTIEESPQAVTAQLYASESSVASTYGQEFSLSYSISRYDVASGHITVSYDDTMFEVVSLTKGGYLTSSLFDANTATKGQAYVSFISQEDRNGSTLFTVAFRQIKNETSSTEIKATVTDLYTDGLDAITVSSNPKCTVTTTYDSAFDVNPKMFATPTLDTAKKQLDVLVSLESDAHLGAGDFILTFDKELLSYEGYDKRCSPTFFTVNDKEKQLSQGQVKFSILSTSDMVEACEVIVFHFSYGVLTSPSQAAFAVSGSGLTDALTQPISLDFEGCAVDLPFINPILYWADQYLFMSDPSFAGEGQGRCVSEGLYSNAKAALLALGNEFVADFSSEAKEEYAAPLARYLAWASANHDAYPFLDDSTYLHPSFALLSRTESQACQRAIEILSLSGISLTIGAIILVKGIRRRSR